jgi:hypothetical protein
MSLRDRVRTLEKENHQSGGADWGYVWDDLFDMMGTMGDDRPYDERMAEYVALLGSREEYIKMRTEAALNPHQSIHKDDIAEREEIEKELIEKHPSLLNELRPSSKAAQMPDAEDIQPLHSDGFELTNNDKPKIRQRRS